MKASVMNFAAVLLMVFGCVTVAAHGRRHATVCDVVRHPATFAGQALDLSARLESDGLEHVLLVDDICPKRGLVLRYSPKLVPKSLRSRLDSLIGGPGVGTNYTDIRGDFIGVFVWNRREETSNGQFIFEMDGLTHLRVSKRTKRRSSPFPELQ